MEYGRKQRMDRKLKKERHDCKEEEEKKIVRNNKCGKKVDEKN